VIDRGWEIEMLHAVIKSLREAGLTGAVKVATAQLEKLIDAQIDELRAEMEEL
jgi:hypothetical protein